jgi:hypothetical protein
VLVKHLQNRSKNITLCCTFAEILHDLCQMKPHPISSHNKQRQACRLTCCHIFHRHVTVWFDLNFGFDVECVGLLNLASVVRSQ